MRRYFLLIMTVIVLSVSTTVPATGTTLFAFNNDYRYPSIEVGENRTLYYAIPGYDGILYTGKIVEETFLGETETSTERTFEINISEETGLSSSGYRTEINLPVIKHVGSDSLLALVHLSQDSTFVHVVRDDVVQYRNFEGYSTDNSHDIYEYKGQYYLAIRSKENVQLWSYSVQTQEFTQLLDYADQIQSNFSTVAMDFKFYQDEFYILGGGYTPHPDDIHYPSIYNETHLVKYNLGSNLNTSYIYPQQTNYEPNGIAVSDDWLVMSVSNITHEQQSFYNHSLLTTPRESDLTNVFASSEMIRTEGRVYPQFSIGQDQFIIERGVFGTPAITASTGDRLERIEVDNSTLQALWSVDTSHYNVYSLQEFDEDHLVALFYSYGSGLVRSNVIEINLDNGYFDFDYTTDVYTPSDYGRYEFRTVHAFLLTAIAFPIYVLVRHFLPVIRERWLDRQ